MEPVELQEIGDRIERPASAKHPDTERHLHQTLTPRLSNISVNNDPVENLPSPTTAAAARLERWNAPRTNLWRTFAAFWSFVVMGANDAAYGVCPVPWCIINTNS